MGGKDRRQITLDPEVDDAINENADNFSGFVNKVAHLKYVEGRGHSVERVLTDEVNEEIRTHISKTEDKLEAMRERADEMRKRADSVEEAADEVERELDELRGLVDDAVESAEISIEADEEDITATSIADKADWDEVVKNLSDIPYRKLAWHRDDVYDPEKPSDVTVNQTLKNEAEKLGIHHDELLDKLVEEGHVTEESKSPFKAGRDGLEIETTDEDG